MTIQDARSYAKDPNTKQLQLTLILAREHLNATRKHVNSYRLPLFRSFSFKADAYAEDTGEELSDPEQLYCSGDEEKVQRYYEAVGEAHAEHGYDIPEGYCPILIAEDEVRQAENALIDHGQKYFKELTRERVTRKLSLREQYLQLLMNTPETALQYFK